MIFVILKWDNKNSKVCWWYDQQTIFKFWKKKDLNRWLFDKTAFSNKHFLIKQLFDKYDVKLIKIDIIQTKKKGKKSNKILKIQRIEQIILTFFIHI